MPLKLWEAILIGSDRRAQAFGTMFDFDRTGDQWKTCALGAVYETQFGVPRFGSHYDFRDLFKHFPILCTQADMPGIVPSQKASVDKIMVWLNDTKKWPREKIALEFVKPIEEGIEE